MDYFKTFSVKVNKETEGSKDWPVKYKVLMLDITQQTERVLKEKKVDTHKKTAKQLVTQEDLADEDDDISTELTDDDYTTQESIRMWLLLGNDKTGELRWFSATEVSFVEAS